jgi:hypothetical protein
MNVYLKGFFSEKSFLTFQNFSGGIEMKVINTWADLQLLKKSESLPQSFMLYLEKECMDLMNAYYDCEWMEDFSLEPHGNIVVLEPGDSIPEGIGESVWVEYVEKVSLDDVEVFRMFVLETEDYGVLYYSIVGSLDAESEAILQEYAEMNEG